MTRIQTFKIKGNSVTNDISELRHQRKAISFDILKSLTDSLRHSRNRIECPFSGSFFGVMLFEGLWFVKCDCAAYAQDLDESYFTLAEARKAILGYIDSFRIDYNEERETTTTTWKRKATHGLKTYNNGEWVKTHSWSLDNQDTIVISDLCGRQVVKFTWDKSEGLTPQLFKAIGSTESLKEFRRSL